MNIKTKLGILVSVLVRIIKLDPDSTFQIVIIVILVSLILGSSILADILLEQLLQADGATRLSPP